MKRLVGLVVLGLLGAALVAPALAQDKDKDDKAPSIKQIMTKAHKGADSALAKAKGALKEGDFDALEKSATTLVKLGSDLSKAKPPRGERESWMKLTSGYVKAAKTLEKAAREK